MMLIRSLIQMRQNPLVVILGGGVIAWRSVRKTIIAWSTMESKFVDLEIFGSEVKWLKNFLANIPLGMKPTSSLLIHYEWNMVLETPRGMRLKPLINKEVMLTQPLWLEIPWIRFMWVKMSHLLVMIELKLILNQFCRFLWRVWKC